MTPQNMDFNMVTSGSMGEYVFALAVAIIDIINLLKSGSVNQSQPSCL